MAYKVSTNASFGKLALTPPVNFPAPVVPYGTALTRARGGGAGSSFPVFDQGMVFSDIGNSGLRQFSGWVREEFLPQLQGREASRVYREMLDNSSVVGSIIFSINAAIRRVDWRMEPADSSSEANRQAEFIDGCKSDMSHTWSDFIIESLSMLGYGYAPHEIVYKRSLGRRPGIGPDGKELPKSQFKDGLIRWRRLPLRGQDTVLKWFFGQNGEILGMTQQPWNAPLVDIPIQKMMLFRPTSHKNNPEGRSILRTAYRSYYLAKRMEELESIMFERMGGIPVITVPKQLLDDAAAGEPNSVATLEVYKKIATNVRIDEQMGLILPSDVFNNQGATPQYKFELVTPAGGKGQSVDSDKAITRYNINIMTSILADFLQLGHESRGTQSLAVSKVDMFFQAMEGFLNSNADVMNRHGIPRLCDLNGFDPEKNPEMQTDMPQRMDLDVLSNFILRLSQSGMPLFPNETLQEFVLDAAGMPDVTEDDAYQVLNDNKMAQQQLSLDSARQAAEGNANPDASEGDKPQARTDLEKMLAASLARRIMKMGGSASGGRRRRRHRH